MSRWDRSRPQRQAGCGAVGRFGFDTSPPKAASVASLIRFSFYNSQHSIDEALAGKCAIKRVKHVLDGVELIRRGALLARRLGAEHQQISTARLEFKQSFGLLANKLFDTVVWAKTSRPDGEYPAWSMSSNDRPPVHTVRTVPCEQEICHEPLDIPMMKRRYATTHLLRNTSLMSFAALLVMARLDGTAIRGEIAEKTGR